ncbi:hypothetical protein DFR43_11530 [Tepidicella xavieri]|jgi:hypothetical protein|uniref:Exopolysaccharide synthesis protein ExoD n=2 Tax=Tepidicella xavieri TaxID=360241 RepID=A0A4R6U7E0_9BURK|nr:hypothetical protein DFR43_11530 [Tepidicella xavieri]
MAMQPSPEPSTLAATFRAALQHYRSRCAHGDGPRLSLAELVRLHGHSSAHVLLIVMAALSMVPMAGAGNVMGFGMLAMAWALWRGHDDIHLPRRIGEMALGRRWADRVLDALVWLYGMAERWLRPRWHYLLHRATRYWWSAWIVAMTGIIFLPLPLGNVLPSLSLMLLALGWMFRDGVALVAAMLTGATAMAYTALFWGVVVQAMGSVYRWLA